MFRLTREVRFAVNGPADGTGGARQPGDGERVTNGYGGWPAIQGLGHYLALSVTLAGQLDPEVHYLTNIKHIDAAVRQRAISIVARHVQDSATDHCPARLVAALFDQLKAGWNGPELEAVSLALSPFCSVAAHRQELPMTRFSQKFEFSASHRLFSPSLSDEENRLRYGKCANPHGHGHNYELQVTLIGEPKSTGRLVDVPAFERTVSEQVIQKFDHKNLNVEVAEFADGKLIPSVENIAKVIYRILKPHLANADAKLASVTVWETPKTWCEYRED